MMEKEWIKSLTKGGFATQYACIYGGRESSMRCNFRKHMQIEKSPASQENIFINLTEVAANAHNINKYKKCIMIGIERNVA